MLFTPADYRAYGDWKGATSVAIDVLRATTVLTTALEAGAAKAIPAAEIDTARALKEKYGDGVLLGGERDCRLIPGFDLANSPREYTAARVSGKTIVLTTSNGTQTMQQAQAADAMILVCLRNIGAAADWLAGRELRRVVIACSGCLGSFALDDAVTAGVLVSELEQRCQLTLDDSAWAAKRLAESYTGHLADALLASISGRRLVERDLADDIGFCAKTNQVNAVPLWQGAYLVRAGN